MTRGHSAANRPNVVFILADDLGWCDLGIEGSRFYESPHIDRLARGGMRFTQGYAACASVQPLARQHPDRQVPAAPRGDRLDRRPGRRSVA